MSSLTSNSRLRTKFGFNTSSSRNSNINSISSSQLPPRSNSLVSLNSNHSSGSSNLNLKYSEEGEEEEEPDWFKREFCLGSFKTQTYHNLPPSIAPYWISYSQGALNWDSLTTFSSISNHKISNSEPLKDTFNNLAIPPRRVLSLGSGVPFWELHMANLEGWKSTEFVCLDIAPYSIPIETEIPIEISSRITFVQHNFLDNKGLPFSDSTFDFCRISNVGIGCPEHKWELIVEEANRVLLPGATLEILDSNFTIYKPLNLSPSFNSFKMIEDCFDAVLNSSTRFINSHTLQIIPSQLSLFCTNIQSTGALIIPLPTLNGEGSEDSRIQLHAYAERLASSSYGIARDGASVEYERLKKKETSTEVLASMSESDGILLERLQKKVSKEKRLEELQKERVQALNEWTSELKDLANLSGLLEDKWNWKCKVDLEAKEILEENLPVYKSALVEIENITKDEENFTDEKELESRRNQMIFAQREAEVDLKAINKRLGTSRAKGDGSGNGNEVMGYFESATFTARAK